MIKQLQKWWLASGCENCPTCLQAYAYESEYRCEACDAAVCPCCAAPAWGREVFCPDCRQEANEV